MNGKFLLDTNIVVPILNQDPLLLELIRDSILYIPVIVLGELYFGARNSGRVAANLSRVEALRSRCVLLMCDEKTADVYSEIRYQLKVKGRLIPENDIWIAAIARQYNLTLVTRDEHFQAVDRLILQRW